MVLPLVALILKLALARNHEPVLLKIDLDILQFDAQQRDLNIIALFRFAGIHLGREAGPLLAISSHGIIKKTVKHGTETGRHRGQERVRVFLNNHHGI